MNICTSEHTPARGHTIHRRPRANAARVGVAVGICVLLAGCGGISELSAPVASYGSASVFSPAGYGQSKVDDTHYNVTATGTEATPKARVEKIARARAAQIGVEEKLKFFKVTSVQHGFACVAREPGYKSESTPAASRPTVTLAVEYAKEPADGFVSSKETYDSLTAEIAGDVVGPEQKAAATQETRAGCGRQG